MKRKTFDKLASMIGGLLAVILIAAGALLTWGGTFANNQVKDQLAAQKITLPTATHNPKEGADVTAFFSANGGKLMTTGKQAQMYADHYIAFHLTGIGAGKVYSELSGEEMGVKAQLAADPKNATLAAHVATLDGQVNTVFKGESLRGMLLNAYAFWQLGQIAMIASWVSYLGGLIFLILALLGFAHSRRTSEDAAI
jgi:hypothetical protein